MKIRFILALIAITSLFLACDEPLPTIDSNYIYNPFTFNQDTLSTDAAIEIGRSDFMWNDHEGVWFGENPYFKAGFSVDFTFPDTLYNSDKIDSIMFEVRHVYSFPSVETDTIICVDVYETSGVNPDISNSIYGEYLGCDSLKINGSNDIWNIKLPADVITSGDSILNIGIFPHDSTVLSMLYGGSSSLIPALSFYSFQADTTDSLGNNLPLQYFRTVADTVYGQVFEKPGTLDRDEYYYITQFSNDSLIFSVDLASIVPVEDTLMHVDTVNFIPAIDTLASWIKIPLDYEVNPLFLLTVTDPVSSASSDIVLGADGIFLDNQIASIIQIALDDDRTVLDLILKPNNVGYDPGFIAISKNGYDSELQIQSSWAVRP